MGAYKESKHRLDRLNSPVPRGLAHGKLDRFVAAHPPTSQVTPEAIRTLRPLLDSVQVISRVGALLHLGDVYSSAHLDERALAIYLADEEVHWGAVQEFPSDFALQATLRKPVYGDRRRTLAAEWGEPAREYLCSRVWAAPGGTGS